MNLLIKNLKLLSISFIIWYILISFQQMSLNPNIWNSNVRGEMVLLIVITYIIILLCVNDIGHSNDIYSDDPID